MPSVVIAAFRNAVAAGLSDNQAGLLREPIGCGPQHRELSRALMLADRTAREWVATALAALRSGEPNRFDKLPQLGRPEDGYHELDPAARAERDAATEPGQRALVQPAGELAAALPRIDTEASNEQNREAFEATAQAAATCLLRAGVTLGGEEITVAQANSATGDLIALSGWTNQLGSRFE